MPRIKSIEELEYIREQVKSKVDLREKGNCIEEMIVIRVAMSTCGITSGAKEVLVYLADLIKEKNLQNVVLIQSDCMGYCNAEPTIEVTFPNQEPVLYGYVNGDRAKKILERHILNQEVVEEYLLKRHESFKQ